MADLLLLTGALNEDILSSLAENILARDGEATVQLSFKLLEEGREPYLLASELAKHFLNLAKASYLQAESDPEARCLISGSPAYIDRLITASRGLDRSEISQIVELLDRLEQVCKRSSQPALHLEIGLLSLCHRLDIIELRSLNERVHALEGLLQETNTFDSVPARKPSPQSERHGGQGDHIKNIWRQPSPHSTSQQTPDQKPVDFEEESAKLPPVSARDSISISDISHTAVPIYEIEDPSSRAFREEVGQKPDSLNVPTLSTAVIAPSAEETRDVVDSVIIENIENENKSSPKEVVVVSKIAEHDLNALWADLLDELQKRNIPTFSLVSTHAFPLSMSDSELAIGVSVEHFQKMIEAKLDHIKAALEAVGGKQLLVKVKLKMAPPTEEASPAREPRKSKARSSFKQDEAKLTNEPEKSNDEQVSKTIGESPDVSPRFDQGDSDRTSISADVSSESKASNSLGPSMPHIIQEAYKLFEGPGSRLISSP